MKAMATTHQSQWETPVEEDQWMALWQLQREEISARLQVQNTEKRNWNDTMAIIDRDKTKLPKNIHSSSAINAPSQGPMTSPRYMYPTQVPHPPTALLQTQRPAPYTPTAQQTSDLRHRISALSETKQILLSQFVNIRAPRAITKDATGMATIDPYLLDGAAFADVLTHLKLLEDDDKRSKPELPPAWNTGYVGDLPPRISGTRPNGTINSGRARPGSRASFTWEDMQPLPPKVGTSPRKTMATPRQIAAPDPVSTPRLTDEERAEREALANRIATLSEAHQRTISQEVRLFCPQAIFQATPGYATINTSELDRRTYLRVRGLVEELSELSKQDEVRERERSIRRQVEREQFISRERARERERALDVELERRAREEQIKEELERDLERVRTEVEMERRQRWQQEGEERREKLMERSTPRLPPAEKPEKAERPQETDEILRNLRRKLAETLRELNDENMFTFADYALQLQPEAVDSQNNSIHPNRFDKSTLPLAVNYACQLKATQKPVYRLTAPPEKASETPITAPAPVQNTPSARAEPIPATTQPHTENGIPQQQVQQQQQLQQAHQLQLNFFFSHFSR
eukprot:TRINITY_DN1423_c0_g1_i4.p1 TRINITY_DN1423_c0_g1~~TRINITY_DN1423_c0_g1_i4.p1  ORF type:complete len:588 (-),score=93.96 TRINITY_DN1423_c0_g1_i4:62-1798(-)